MDFWRYLTRRGTPESRAGARLADEAQAFLCGRSLEQRLAGGSCGQRRARR